eukprot:CAMPEP_0179322090 /NCGR_PEP_ID=MMETSP0797-20121207/58986_1 /TAXON_ID=47934 /ORGANISM="Dinophysis acuminata, Strain DAEP01" /LENGTH=71 /DNA_ID=CAMNT_0021033811 /DNA_START=24 /DNA_END=236 /DNA_ORIENTATION=-
MLAEHHSGGMSDVASIQLECRPPSMRLPLSYTDLARMHVLQLLYTSTNGLPTAAARCGSPSKTPSARGVAG